MPLKFWRETRPSENLSESRRRRSAGAITIIVVFVYFMFSTLGLGLFMLTRMFRLWSGNKSNAVLIAAAAENGARAGFAALEETLAGRAFPLALSAEEFEELRSLTLAGGTDAVTAALGVPLPLLIQGTGADLEWTAATEFQPERVVDSEFFISVDFSGAIDARGKLSRRLRTKRSVLDIGLSVMAGRIPLSAFPFLLAGEKGQEQTAKLIAEKKVILSPSETGGGRLFAAATDRLLIPTDATAQLAEALKINMFSPDRLTIAQLRQALGLPLVNEPVPDGVYLMVGDNGLGGLFVQGDVEELLLAASSGRQYLQFRLEEGTWRIWFNPAESWTEFAGPGEIRTFDRSPLPIVCINGNVASLGGGIVEATGNLALSVGTEAPSILAGVSLTIVSSGETVLTSHLIQEGVRWTDGVPYLKDSTAQLFLYASGSDFITGAETNGRIRVGAGAPADLYLQASLTARDGIQIDGKDRKIMISGSVQTSDLNLGSNSMNIIPDDRLLSSLQSPNASPRTTDPVLFVTGWEAVQWSDQ